jgi:hypothetical protein
VSRTRSIVIYASCAIFTAIGIAMAYDAKTALEPWLGIAYAFVFAGCGVALAANTRLNRGPRAAPSAPLRIGTDGRTGLDRLDLFESPARLLVIGGAALVFVLAGFIIPFIKPDIVGAIVGAIGVCLGASAIVSAFIMASSRVPLISIGLDSLEYRTPFRPLMVVRYQDIGEISVSTQSSNRFVGIGAADLDAVIASTTDPRVRRRLLHMVRWTGTPWVLPIAVPMSADQLMGLIVEYVEAFRKREGQPALTVTPLPLNLPRKH